MADVPSELRRCLDDWVPRAEVIPLAGDASTRAYFRVAAPGGERYMAAFYPDAERPSLAAFLRAYESLAPVAPLPELLHHGEAATLQQDVGDITLFEILETDRKRGIRLYRQAVDVLVAFQSAPPAAREINPPFSAEKFQTELAMTREFWVEAMCEARDPSKLAGLEALFRRLSERLTEHPYVLCHRDFHGQNLHALNDQIFIIDYQDLRMGPDTYDLASLLRDRGVARSLGPDGERDLVAYYRERTGADADLERRYRETLLQRSLKIVGTFARQSIERSRHHYLGYIPPTLEAIRFCLAGLPEFAPLLEVFPMRAADGGPATLAGRGFPAGGCEEGVQS